MLLFGYTVRISAFCENCLKTVQTLVYISLLSGVHVAARNSYDISKLSCFPVYI
jgi:hypothetical protein